jgi:hypothetical protein
MPTLLAIFHHLELALRLHAALPGVPLDTAFEHAVAATRAADENQLAPELLLAIAYVESRFDPTAVSRVVGDRRRVGAYPSTLAPRGLNLRAGLFCGPLQTRAASWSQCTQMRDLDLGYGAAVEELGRWLRDRRVRGNIRRALAGHGCGNWGVTTGRCNGYPNRVLAIERRIHEINRCSGRSADCPRRPRAHRAAGVAREHAARHDHRASSRGHAASVAVGLAPRSWAI